MVLYAMSRINKESTIEDLINNLDQRGLLVFYVLLGQRAMQVLSEDKTKEALSTKIPSKLLLPSNDNVVNKIY